MQKWEYKLFTVKREAKGAFGPRYWTTNWEWRGSEGLNSLGQEGWELVAVIPIASKSQEAFSGTTTEVVFHY